MDIANETDEPAEQYSYGNNCDACRTQTCPSRIHVRDMISERGSVTLCRDCRQQLAEVRA